MADGWHQGAYPNNDDAMDIAAIRLAVDQGVILIDTAQNYAAGHC
jgi:aryl-alcohol dehydrogenase-like predicted oxidoreductase